MSINRRQVNYYTGDPIDKIVHEGTITITNDGITSEAPQSSKIVESVIANPYAKKCFCRFVYSVDGGASYNGQDAHLAYTYTISGIPPAPAFSTTLGGLRAAVSVGVDAGNITFRTANGYHGNVSDNGSNYFYTPISQTFIIKYALFEVE